MKFWFVKFGTIFAILKREGLWHGTKSVVRASYDNLRKVFIPLHGDVLLISAGVGASVRYRTEHVAEELSLHGIKAVATMQGHPSLTKAVDEFSVFVLHRTFYTKKLEQFIQKIKEQGKTIIFETDDLVFDSIFSKNIDHLNHISKVEQMAHANCTGAEIIKDEYVRAATTTTHFLAEKIRKYNKKVFIVPNKLSQNDVEIAEDIYKSYNEKSLVDKSVRIGYFSGSKSHDKDFETVIDSISYILDANKNVLLYIVGHLSVDPKFLHKFQEQIIFLPFAGQREHFKNIVNVDINIVPLERNPFCDAKSEIKFLEAGMVRVPTVAVANPTFSNIIKNGRNGFLASNGEDWKKYLQELIDDVELHKRMGENAYKTVVERYTTEAANNDYVNFLKNILDEKDNYIK